MAAIRGQIDLIDRLVSGSMDTIARGVFSIRDENPFRGPQDYMAREPDVQKEIDSAG